MIENVVLVITAVFLAANLVADLLYAWLDPRLSR
jgi:ABC-type dipeptide/oligopeptide/nickel transport system permease component